MTVAQKIIGIFLFAIVTAILYLWGLKKSATQAQDLERILLSKCAHKIMRSMKQKPLIDQKGIAEQVAGMKAGLFWSRQRIQVNNPQEFSKKVIAYMLEQQMLEDAGGLRYRRKQ